MSPARVAARVLIGAGTIISLLFITYDWVSGATKSRALLPALERELSTLALPPRDQVMDEFSGYKSGHAYAGRWVISPHGWETLRAHYETELTRLGWTRSENEQTRQSWKEYGGMVVLFQKGQYAFTLFYCGPSPSHHWNYALDVSNP